jgi:hypothetical protein
VTVATKRSRPVWSRVSGAIALALALLPAASVLAQPAKPAPAAPASDARAAFDAAQKLYDEHKFDEAREQFMVAYRASQSPNARLMAARCLTALDRLAEAYEEMAATSREATARAEQDPKYVPTRDAAATQLAMLERRIGKLTVVVTDFVAGTEVKVNGAPLAIDALGHAVAVTPGPVTVEVRAPGAEPIVREASIGAAEAQTITIALARPVAPVIIVAPPAPVVPPARINAVRAAGIAVGGFGVVGMAVFAGAGLSANAKFAELQRACGNTRCTDPAQGSTVDAGRTLDTVANIAVTAGAVGLLGGALMIAFGGPKKAPVAATSRGISLSF